MATGGSDSGGCFDENWYDKPTLHPGTLRGETLRACIPVTDTHTVSQPQRERERERERGGGGRERERRERGEREREREREGGAETKTNRQAREREVDRKEGTDRLNCCSTTVAVVLVLVLYNNVVLSLVLFHFLLSGCSPCCWLNCWFL